MKKDLLWEMGLLLTGRLVPDPLWVSSGKVSRLQMTQASPLETLF